MWCSPYFSSSSVPAYEYTLPPSSSPCEIYNSLCKDIKSGDKHSAKVGLNKAGILRGANYKEQTGVINKRQKREIYAIVNCAELDDFRPLIFVIPMQSISQMIKEVAIGEKAHPLSVEFRIERLPRQFFDVIEFL